MWLTHHGSPAAGVDVDREVVADLGVVELPERDHALVGRTAQRAAGVVEEVLRVPAVLARVGGRHHLHELEAHHLGVEAVGGLGVTGGECDVVKSHVAIVARHHDGMFLGEDLLAWLVLALGGALFVGNVAAIVRPPDVQRDEANLTRAPIARSLAMALLGFVAAVWALGSLIVG